MSSHFQMQLLVLIFAGAVLSISFVVQGSPVPEESATVKSDTESGPSGGNGTSVVPPDEQQPSNNKNSPDGSGRKDSRFMSSLSELGSKLTSTMGGMMPSGSSSGLLGMASSLCKQDKTRSKACKS